MNGVLNDKYLITGIFKKKIEKNERIYQVKKLNANDVDLIKQLSESNTYRYNYMYIPTNNE